jgi:RimJ/RimL family protein N-acetyltransferase
VSAVRLRPATNDDRERLFGLIRDERIAASLSVVAETTLADTLERTAAGDPDGAALVVEDARGKPVGLVCWSTRNRRSRIAGMHTLAIDPAAHGRGHAVAAVGELARWLVGPRGFHRVEAEIYGYNAAGVRVFTAAGFTQEGVRRRAYARFDDWQDGVMCGLLAEDLA